MKFGSVHHALGLVLLMGVVLLSGCTTVATNPYDEPGAGPSPSALAVDACNPIGHMKCIYLTGREVLADGADGKFTFHWWRMSYIGRACEDQYGRTAGVIAEALFAIPHYSAIAIGNTLAVLAYPFRRNRDDEDGDGEGDSVAERPELSLDDAAEAAAGR